MKNKSIYKQSLVVILITLYIIIFIYYLFIRNTIRFNNIIINQDEYDEIIFGRQEYKDELLEYIDNL